MPTLPLHKQELTEPENLQNLHPLPKKASARELASENKLLESELHKALEEIAHLQNALANVSMRLEAYRNDSAEPMTVQAKDLPALREMIEEIQTPLYRISNYCELLLSQSIGTLGSLQTKFLERIAASTTQAQALVDELEKNLLAGIAPPILDQNKQNIRKLLEEVLSEESRLLQEKRIIVVMEVPENLPEIDAKKEGLHAICAFAVENALKVTPKDGKVSFSASIDKGRKISRLLLKIRDGGPGISGNNLLNLSHRDFDPLPEEIPGLGMTKKQLLAFYQTLKQQGSKIRFVNEPGCGLTMELGFFLES